ncbi:flavodoxin domain-containing protein [Pusillimonas sp. CC-YST705]|uniref:NADPH--hemoprotein reductase n=1 Tax=Mesopusillimonas faecipullorum TaxID=2755040 RepID=A0ABS8C9Q8_9BURK|nr:sulfite reductase subunit alpha [Mesopusillimonas faecipullorum]MCB5362757.1 flavodoxin domain-containing protein [Mesopusillimonas faecipullorum]
MNTPLLTTGLLIAAWLVLVWFTVWRPARLRHEQRREREAALTPERIAVIYASQGGTATELAERTAASLGARALVIPLNELEPASLARFGTALFVVSTYGEGDPPDMAQGFYRQALQWQTTAGLTSLRFGMLALGDSSYQQFCGFGRQMQEWLSSQGAQPLFETVQVDRLDEAALQQWQTHLNQHFQAQSWQDIPATPWRLVQRSQLNPGSQGAPCYELLLECQAPESASWEAGDIAQIAIGDSGQQRDYSIASTPSEGRLRLLVRQQQQADGSPGLGSYWLTQSLALGGELQLHLRRNAQFHLSTDDRPAIFIGNGTGLAGLRALIQTRHERGQKANWLLFGERQRACDFFWQDILTQWLAQGTLEKLDLAFSRDQAEKRYVHHALREATAQLKDWVARGAVLYVCGSREGMAQDVDQALRDILGAHGYEDLLKRGGYRRDVY